LTDPYTIEYYTNDIQFVIKDSTNKTIDTTIHINTKPSIIKNKESPTTKIKNNILYIEYPHLIKSIDQSKIYFKNDSLQKKPIDIHIGKDNRSIEIQNYINDTIHIDSTAITYYTATTNTLYTQKVNIIDSSTTTSSIGITFAVTHNYIVDIIKGNKIVYSLITNKELIIKNIEAGIYTIIYTIDQNNNGVYDQGNPFEFIPNEEKVTYQKDIQLKPNMDLRYNVD
jgi:hypothetical protein